MSAKKISKPIKPSKQEKPAFISTFSLSNYIPEKYHILVFALVILALFLFFFSPLYFGGKTFQSVISSQELVLILIWKMRKMVMHYGTHIFWWNAIICISRIQMV